MNDCGLSVRRRRAGGDVHPLQPAGGGREQSGGADWQGRSAGRLPAEGLLSAPGQ